MLTLLKQARAFGLGIVLATQNSVDLDYKGLANCGTWFLGRLQTERDKARVLDGLEGSTTTAGGTFDRQRMEQTLGRLSSRVFVMNNVHEDAPVVFESRWALSYLRGPLGRHEIRRLRDGASETPRVGSETSAGAEPSHPAPTVMSRPATTSVRPPVLPTAVSQYFLPLRQAGEATVVYHPMVYGSAQWRCADARLKIDTLVDVTVMTPLVEGPVPVDWNAATQVDVGPSDLEAAPAAGPGFVELPANAVNPKSAGAWGKEFVTWVYGGQKVELLQAAHSALVSNPGETERDFRIRLQQASREARDSAVEQLRRKYASKTAALQERVRRAQQAVDRESEQAKAQTLQTAISFGTTLLGAFLGRKAVTASTLGRATTAARGVGRTVKETQDIGRAKETVEAVQQQLAQLEEELQAEIAGVEARFDASSEPLTTFAVQTEKELNCGSTGGIGLGTVRSRRRRNDDTRLVARHALFHGEWTHKSYLGERELLQFAGPLRDGRIERSAAGGARQSQRAHGSELALLLSGAVVGIDAVADGAHRADQHLRRNNDQRRAVTRVRRVIHLNTVRLRDRVPRKGGEFLSTVKKCDEYGIWSHQCADVRPGAVDDSWTADARDAGWPLRTFRTLGALRPCGSGDTPVERGLFARGAILCRTNDPERASSVVHASVNAGRVAAVRTGIDAKSERRCCYGKRRNDSLATAHVFSDLDLE